MTSNKKILFRFFLVLLISLPFGKGRGWAQELNCSVQVITPQASNSTDKKILQTLQQSIFEFMNNRKWTNDVFQQDERIECSLVITITDKSSDVFKGDLQIQARRPVYKSSFNSLLVNIRDKNLEFKYVEYQPLEYVENTFTYNLTSILSFYAYVIIGTDYDSFSLEGGTPYYQKAQTIVSNAQSSSNEKGWKYNEDDHNRYWIVENILNSTYKPLRECIYKYHRMGFDQMSQDLVSGRAAVLSSLELLKNVFESKPGNYSLTLFFLAKSDEIVNLFTPAEPEEKTKVLALVNEIDPANATKYNKINQKSGE